MISPIDLARRQLTLATHRLHAMPVVVLMPHSRCNCRCVMCDIWKANRNGSEIPAELLREHVASMRQLGVRWVVLSGGEALMHSNLWALCALLKELDVKITLLSTGLLLARHAEEIVRWCDEVIVSLDGSQAIHDEIRRVPRAYERLAGGVRALRAIEPAYRVAGRCVLQRQNYADLPNIIAAAHELGLDEISFLAADVSSEAFNRPVPWGDERRADVALSPNEVADFERVMEATIRDHAEDFATFMGQRTLPHHSSYGCPFYCNFCAVVNMVNGRWLAQSAERSAAVAQVLVERWNVDAIEFYDNNFFTHEARTAEFAERIMGLGISWWGEARIDTMLKYSDRTWTLMRDSGLRMVFLGAESGSDETLKRMNKGGKASTEKTLAIAAKMGELGIVPEMSFVLGNPPDPAADVRQTIEFIRKVKRVNPRTEIILYMYTPVPLAGELYDRAKADGFQFPETLEEWISPDWQEFSQRRSTHLPWVKDPLRQQVQDFERVLNAYYPTATDPKLQGLWRWALKSLSAWRYHLRFYQHPLELRALHKVLAYQRPETSGF